MPSPRSALLGAALLAAAALAQAAAPSNAGLRPQRLEVEGRTHYVQLAQEPVAGTVVSAPVFGAAGGGGGGYPPLRWEEAAAGTPVGMPGCRSPGRVPWGPADLTGAAGIARCTRCTRRARDRPPRRARRPPRRARRPPAPPPQVLIHGCGPGARAFFPQDPLHCPECQGYPEYVAQTKQALARGYHVLALQAADAGSNCWSSSTRGGRVDDRPHVRLAGGGLPGASRLLEAAGRAAPLTPRLPY